MIVSRIYELQSVFTLGETLELKIFAQASAVRYIFAARQHLFLQQEK